MVNYYEAGSRSLYFFMNPGGFAGVTKKEQLAIELDWLKAKLKNPDLFNGKLYSCNLFCDNGKSLVIGLNETDYKKYSYFRSMGIPRKGAYAAGNGIFIADPEDGAINLVVRSENKVAFDQGKVSCIGGVLDYKKTNMRKFTGYVQRRTLKEVGEEVKVRLWGITAVSLLGLYWDDETYKVEFAYTGTGRVKGVKAKENVKIFKVRKQDLVDFTRENAHRIEASTLVHLQHMAPTLARV